MAHTVSMRRYAESRGVSHQAISAAVAAGVIARQQGGGVDPDQADATWLRRRQQHSATRQLTAAAETRREQALLRTTLAKIQIAKHRAQDMQTRLVERDKSQAVIGGLIARLYTALPAIAADADRRDAPLLREAVDLILRDLGDLQAEALKVTQRE